MAQKNDCPLRLEISELPAAAVVRLIGSAGMGEADRIRLELERLAEREIPTIVLDLAQMDFICSAGLGALIAARIESRRHNSEIRLAGPQPAVMRLLEITRLTKLFPVFQDVEHAMQK